MTIIQAPFELIQTTTYLPDPTLGDSYDLMVNINRLISMNNTRYTYVKNKNRRKLNLTFYLDYGKRLELKAFIEAYLTSNIKLTLFDGTIWNVQLVSEPLTHTTKVRNSRSEILLAFEGVRIYAPTINC